jgi:hypothetical protein
LYDAGAHTLVSLTQDKNASEEDREHAETSWGVMLANFKQLLETVEFSRQ